MPGFPASCFDKNNERPSTKGLGARMTQQVAWFMKWKLYAGAALALAAFLVFAPAMHAQTTGTLSGTVQDSSGAVIPDAQVSAVNEATNSTRSVTSDGAGFFSFPALDPGSYTVKVTAKGFNGKNISGISLHAGDQVSIASIALVVGAAQQTVTVQAATQIIPVENGAHGALLDYHDIQNLTLFGQDTTELLKNLPGVTTNPNGLGNGMAMSDEYVHTDSSFVGNGLISNGAPSRGGTLQLVDGVDVDDPGCDCSSISLLLPEFTQEVNVQTSNYGADAEYGPVVINATSRSGSTQYHGTGFFYAGNDALNANDWQSKHQHIPKGSAHRYYPGGDIGGPVPFTQKKLLGWFGYERLLQNEGNANILQSYIPSPEMMNGDFSNDNADNNVLCPGGFTSATTGNWCNNLYTTDPKTNITTATTVLPDGTNPAVGRIPSQFIDPASKVLSSFWPVANANPATTPNGYNYYQAITNIDNGWVIRARADYNMSEKTKFFVSYQQAHDSALAQGNGAHIYWTPGNSIPFPGGGIFQNNYTKAASGHFVHVFNASTTNELIAAWGYGSFPFAPPSPTAPYRSTLQYPNYPTVFNGGSKMIPSYSDQGTKDSFPDFEQSDFFFPTGKYTVAKQMPSFSDNFTKVWGAHTVKIGAFTENVDNLQDPFSDLNGTFTFAGENASIVNPAQQLGSHDNPTADFIMGAASNYSEWSKAQMQDLAYQDTSFYVDDSWKVNNRLSVELGARFEHVGHWYDRNGNGVAVFMPNLVLSDWNAGMNDPGIRYHGIDPGVAVSGQPNRLAFISPRFGFSYDVMGTGKTVIRGGWGAYRYSDQYNDTQGALQTAQGINIYNLPGGREVLDSQLGTPQVQATVPHPVPQGQSSSVASVSPNDYNVPLTYSYNLTVDRQLPWNSMLEVAYVGNASSQLTMGGEGIEGSNFTNYVNQNKTPMGAFFLKDPKTGVQDNNLENIGIDRTTGNKNGNSLADYHPFGYAYGTQTVGMNTNTGYQNYNGLQVSWEKRAGRVSFNLNGTWSKTLATSQQRDPFILHNNYGETASDRPYVFNSTYVYSIGDVYHGGQVLQQVLNGWSISGTSTWQAGGYLPTLLGNGVPNFGLSETYTGIGTPSATNPVYGVNGSIGGNTYFGTDAGEVIMPVLTCNPNSGLGAYQHLNLKCFQAPAVGSQGGQKYPYMSSVSYFDNDLALYKTFQIHGSNNIQFRAEVFNWLNHPLRAFSGQNPINQYYNVDYNTKAITLNQAPGDTYSNATYAQTDTKVGNPNQRRMLLVVKYNF